MLSFKKLAKTVVTAITISTLFITSALPAYAMAFPTDTYCQIKGTEIYVSPAVKNNTEKLEKIYYAWTCIPENARNMIKKGNAKIYLDSITERGEQHGGMGATFLPVIQRVQNDKGDWVNPYGPDYDIYTELLADGGRSKNMPYEEERAMIHEVGHIIGGLYAQGYDGGVQWKPSLTNEWIGICRKEVSAFRTINRQCKINSYNTEECWAQAFGMYCWDAKGLYEKCPKMYEYVNKTVNNIK